MAGLKAFEVFGEIALKGASQVKGDLKKTAAEAKEAGGTKGLGGISLSSAAAGAALVGAGIAAVRFGAECVEAAAKAEVGTARLKATVNATGASYDDWKDSIGRTLEAQKLQSAYGGGDLRSSLTTLIRMTGSAAKGQEYLAMATDLARGTGMDLETSAKLIGKVHAGNTAILKRYGIAVREGASSEEALAQVQQMVAGQAEAYSKTMQGQIDILKNREAALKTNIGKPMMPELTRAVGTLEVLTRAGTSWAQKQREIDMLSAQYLITTKNIRTEQEASQYALYEWGDAQMKAAFKAVLAKKKETGAVDANTAALMENREALLESMNAGYEEEDASIAVERAQLRLKDTKKALTDAVKKHGKGSREAKDATLDYREAVLAAKRADDRLIEATPGVTKNLGALRRHWNNVAKAARAAANAAADALDAQYGKGAGKATRDAGGYGGVRHGGGHIANTGLYSLMAGEYVLKRSAAEKLNAGQVTAPQTQPVTVLVDLGEGMRRVTATQVRGGEYRARLAGG